MVEIEIFGAFVVVDFFSIVNSVDVDVVVDFDLDFDFAPLLSFDDSANFFELLNSRSSAPTSSLSRFVSDDDNLFNETLDDG